MGAFQRVGSGGSPLKSPLLDSGWVNGLTEVLNWFRRTKASGEGGTGSGPLESTSGLVKVKNLTGFDLVRGHYVQLGDYMLDDVDHHKHWFEGDIYDAADTGQIAVLTKAIKAGDTSYHAARILGRCTAKINITDITHKFAAPDDGTYVFKSAASGSIPILSANKISGTGVQELSVLLGGSGSSGDTVIHFGICTEQIEIATPFDPDDWGEGMFKEMNWDGSLGAETLIYNRSADIILVGQPFPWIYSPDGDPVVLPPFCNTMSIE